MPRPAFEDDMNEHQASARAREAFEALQAGRAAVAEAIARGQLRETPGHLATLLVLGLSLRTQDRVEEAVAPFRELAERYPQVPENWNNLGNVLRDAGKHEAASAAFRQGLSMAPFDSSLHTNFGLLCLETDDFAVARRHFLRAHELDPGNAVARIQGARAAAECGDSFTAEALLESWPQWSESLTADERIELAWALAGLGHGEEGERLLRAAIPLATDKRRALARLVVLMERLNRLDEAERLAVDLPGIDEVPESDIRHDVASARVALAKRGLGTEQAEALLERLVQQPGPAHLSVGFCFLLGKTKDQRKDAAGALKALERAHELQVQLTAQHHAHLLAPGVKPLHTAGILLSAESYRSWPAAANAPSRQESPIFIVGFPRSGTTMLEQMLDAHPHLVSMDERAFLQMVIEEVPVEYPHDLGKLGEDQCEALRRRYWELVASCVTVGPGQQLVDKNPLNMLRLPIIRRLFPHAKIVLALRHPCDVLWSCYMQHFRAPQFAAMCRSAEHLADGYVDVMNYWIHHCALMQPDVVVSRYEDLLEDFEAQTARLAVELELDDPAPMRRFHEHAADKGYISTPSYSQVVEPPHKRSMGRWRRYESFFVPVLDRLKPIADHWGYEI